MLFESKTLNNIMADMKSTVGGGMSTGQGTLVDHAFRGAAAEFEQAYIELWMVDQNGYAGTADREHLVLRAQERGMEPLKATNAVWKARFDGSIPGGARFSSRGMTYACTGEMGDLTYRLVCEQAGTKGNQVQGELLPIEYIEGVNAGELVELLIPARDVESTEDFRKRYFEEVREPRTLTGNRAYYKQMMHEIDGVGACKIYRATEEERRVKIYFLDSAYKAPSESLVAGVQEIVDPEGKRGDGEGKAVMFHVVDICPCGQETVDVEADILLAPPYAWESVLPGIQDKLDEYFLGLAKGWEDGEYITVRVLGVNTAIAGVEGVVDVQGTAINGQQGNMELGPNAIPVRGRVSCRQR